MQAARQDARHTQTSRNRMIAAIHLQWRSARPDLRNEPEELRDQRLAFITDLLKLKRPLTSMRSLSDRQLGLVLDALHNGSFQPRLPNATVAPASEGAEVIHLASSEQAHTINKLLDWLGWSDEGREKFIQQRFKRTSPAMLSPKNAHSLINILLNIAAARSIRERTGAMRIKRVTIRAEIPALKARLGIDVQKHSEEVNS
jgi:hypothetical protein